jgi:plastocyanin
VSRLSPPRAQGVAAGNPEAPPGRTRVMRKSLVWVVLLAAAIVACGGGSSKSESKPQPSAASTSVSLPGTTNDHGSATAKNGLEMEADDFYFGPTFVKATAGQRFTVELRNKGKATHTFTSAALGIDEQLAPGAEKTVTVTAPSNGFVEFHCRFHQAQGMQGAVIVG